MTPHVALDYAALTAAIKALEPAKKVKLDRNLFSIDGSPAICVYDHEHLTAYDMWSPGRGGKPTGKRSAVVSIHEGDHNKVRFHCKKSGWDYETIAKTVLTKAQGATWRRAAKNEHEETVKAAEEQFNLGLYTTLRPSAATGTTLEFRGLNKEQVLSILAAAKSIGVE